MLQKETEGSQQSTAEAEASGGWLLCYVIRSLVLVPDVVRSNPGLTGRER